MYPFFVQCSARFPSSWSSVEMNGGSLSRSALAAPVRNQVTEFVKGGIRFSELIHQELVDVIGSPCLRNARSAVLVVVVRQAADRAPDGAFLDCTGDSDMTHGLSPVGIKTTRSADM